MGGVGLLGAVMLPFAAPLFLIGSYYLGREMERIEAEMKKYQIPESKMPEWDFKEPLDWYAGGELWGACFAGGALFNPSGLITPFEKIADTEAYFKEANGEILEAIQAPYESLAGGDLFYQNVTKDTILGRFMGT